MQKEFKFAGHRSIQSKVEKKLLKSKCKRNAVCLYFCLISQNVGPDILRLPLPGQSQLYTSQFVVCKTCCAVEAESHFTLILKSFLEKHLKVRLKSIKINKNKNSLFYQDQAVSFKYAFIKKHSICDLDLPHAKLFKDS